MARPPVFPAEEKVRIVLSILAGEMTVAEAARKAKVSEQSVGNWKRQFLEAGKTGLVAGKGDVPWGGVVLDLLRRGDRHEEGHRAMVSETGLGNSRKDIARWPWTSLPCSTC